MNCNKLLLAIQVAMHFLGLPYRWGGDDPIQGFDCSGFCIEILRSVGILPRDGDWTADSLMRMFPAVVSPSAGCLMLVCADGRATHVEFCLDDKHTIGASGGGSATTSEAAAILQNAYIKVRPIRTGSNIRFVNPF